MACFLRHPPDMTKSHASSASSHETAHAERDKNGHERAGGMTHVMQLIVEGGTDPKAIAATIKAHPEARAQILTLLHSRFGNGFVNQVMAEVSGTPAKMDATNFTIAPPPPLDVAAIFAEMDAPAEAPLGPARDVVQFDRSGEYMESRATIDAPVTTEEDEPSRGDAKPKGTWVTRAIAYNRAHPDQVLAFNQATNNACIDPATGELDPQKVARWQVANGAKPDGRVGEGTMVAAIINAPM